MSQWSYYEPLCPSPTPTASYACQAIAAENCVRHVVGVDIPLGQMFEARGGEYQRPAQHLHTIMVCKAKIVAQEVVLSISC
jgi:hypothetical protein